MIVGIDLGTTNSLVSAFIDGKARIIPNALHENLTPSVVGLDDEGQIIVGKLARERLITHPDLTVAGFKRYMGTDRQTRLGKRRFRPEELSALVLRALKADAEACLGEAVTEAVITVPAYFNDTQRKATKIAGELAGLKVDRLLNEPTAAALAYGVHTNKEQRYLVFDLGGGTFDVSVVEYFEGILEVHASAGNNKLGGNDFTDLIHQRFTQELVAAKFSKQPLPAPLSEQVRKRAEEAKYALGHEHSVETRITWKEREHRLQINQETFESLSANLLDKIASPVRQALRDAKLKVQDLDQIVFVGGATRMPIVRKLATRMFQRFAADNIDPDQVVAVGAAIQAGLKSKDAALDDTVMTDVCPYTLGVEVTETVDSEYKEGFFLPIIERNGFIPVSRVKTVTTLHEQQRHVDVNVYQGESPMVKDNVYLGTLNIDIPDTQPGKQELEIRFTYDVNGLLEVETTLLSSGKTKAITIEQNPGLMSQEEITRRLEELQGLKVHPREHTRNRLLIHRAERMYAERLGKEREHVKELLARFLAVLDNQDEREIREALMHVNALLDHLEGTVGQE